jgi:hypothetical protein
VAGVFVSGGVGDVEGVVCGVVVGVVACGAVVGVVPWGVVVALTTVVGE